MLAVSQPPGAATPQRYAANSGPVAAQTSPVVAASSAACARTAPMHALPRGALRASCSGRPAHPITNTHWRAGVAVAAATVAATRVVGAARCSVFVAPQRPPPPEQQQQLERLQPCSTRRRRLTAAASGARDHDGVQASTSSDEPMHQMLEQQPRPLDCSRAIAWCRAREGSSRQPIVVDPYAEVLASTSPSAEPKVLSDTVAAQHIAATRYIDDMLLRVMDTTSVNRISRGDYRQVVLLGDGFDTRPFRMLWPQGTIIFLVAPSECHELAEAVLKQAGARVPRGCMLRRVNADLTRPEPSFGNELAAAGFRGDRVSAWALQGLAALGLSQSQLSAVLVDVSSLAAFHSLVLGELPAMARRDAENALADAGLLGTTVPLDGPEMNFRERVAAETEAANSGSGGESGDGPIHMPWLFSTQQMRLSLAQIGTHKEFSAEYDGLDEDFIDNFS